MKATIELPDHLLTAARKQAAEERASRSGLMERALRKEPSTPQEPVKRRPKNKRVIVDGVYLPGWMCRTGGR